MINLPDWIWLIFICIILRGWWGQGKKHKLYREALARFEHVPGSMHFRYRKQ